MELPQPRPYGAEGSKTTHDFLSLYSPLQQDPRPSQGGYFRTHDFLQPLEEKEGKSIAKEESSIEVEIVDKSPPLVTPSVTHILPGGIGTYSICYNDQRVPKPEANLFRVAQASSADRNDENNSNCSSYSGSGFTLWDESIPKKGKTGKENISGDRHITRGVNLGGGQWSPLERQSQSSSSHKLNNMAQSSPSSSHAPSVQKSQGFINMMTPKSAQDEDDDEEEEFIVKKEPSSLPKGNLSVKVDARSTDQKPNTPRSKHSATEQRRRSKINDRFQKLRTIIPNSDQKRDKASFLLEVIEYIQYLQEKVQKYEGPYQGWNHEPSKPMPWGERYGSAQGIIDQSQCTNSFSGQSLLFATKLEANKNIHSQTMLIPPGNTIAAPKEHSQRPESMNKASPPLQLSHDTIHLGVSSSAAAQISPQAAPIPNNTASHLRSHFGQSKSSYSADSAFANDIKQKESEHIIDSGTITMSTAYSQGLLNSLTQALQNSGVDLSQASISVQVDLGKKAKTRPCSSAAAPKDHDDAFMSNRASPKPIAAVTGEEHDRGLKRIRTSRS